MVRTDYNHHNDHSNKSKRWRYNAAILGSCSVNVYIMIGKLFFISNIVCMSLSIVNKVSMDLRDSASTGQVHRSGLTLFVGHREV